MTEPRKKGRHGHRYSDEFKREAVQMLANPPAIAPKVSAQLGVSVGTLWGQKTLTGVSTSDERPRYEELAKEVGRLKVENDFLIKVLSRDKKMDRVQEGILRSLARRKRPEGVARRDFSPRSSWRSIMSATVDRSVASRLDRERPILHSVRSRQPIQI